MKDCFDQDNLRDGFGRFFRHGMRGHQIGKGDMSIILLLVLQKKPMHGYEIIRHLEERSHGFWRPSAGSIYPTLQLLEDQGLISHVKEDGKKIYSLTQEGKKMLDEKTEDHQPKVPWGRWSHNTPHHAADMHDLLTLIRPLLETVRNVALSGSDQTRTQAKQIITEASEKLNHLLDDTNSSKHEA